MIRVTSVAAVVATLASNAGAQRSTPCPAAPGLAAVPGTIVGTVSDAGHLPLDSVEIFIVSPRRQTASIKGAFRLDRLEPDSYHVTARRIGYESQTHTVIVGDNGGVATFCLVPATQILETVVSSAPRPGLMGVVADTMGGGIPAAEISVLGTFRERTESDSVGIFYVPLKPGKYVVRVKHEGFGTKMVSITIPSDSGRKVLIWLEPSRRGASPREEAAARELEFRLDTAQGVRSKIFTREDITNFPSTELKALAQAGAVSWVDENCDAVIDGGPYTMPIWSLSPADLEMVEVYTDKPPRAGVTSILFPPKRTPTTARCPHVYVWRRK